MIIIDQKQKEEWEAKITAFNKPIAHYDGVYISSIQLSLIEEYEELLAQAIVVHIEENWGNVLKNTRKHKEYDYISSLNIEYPNGVIIKTKT